MDLGFNWFDLCVAVLMIVGIIVGRKRGMSLELLSMLQWLAIVFLSAMICGPFGSMLADLSGVGPVVSYIAAYLLVAIVIKVVFVMIRRMIGEKLISGEFFGNFEYYLGMMAGLVRFACIILFVLALLNAQQVSKADLAAQLKSQQEWAGSIYFPPFGTIQRAIFEESISGRMVKEYLSDQLINVNPSAGGGARENLGRRREREINEIANPK